MEGEDGGVDTAFQNDHENIPKHTWNRQRNTTERISTYTIINQNNRKQMPILLFQTLELHIFTQ